MCDNQGEVSATHPENIDLQMSDKADFREKSSSFLKLLEESSKYRKKETLPDPQKQKPGLSPRLDDSEEATTPRLERRAPESAVGATAKRNISSSQVEVPIDPAIPNENKSRYSQFGSLPPATSGSSTPRGDSRAPVQRQVSLPPVAGPDRRKMNDVLMFSRQGSDIHSRLKKTSGQEGGGGYGSAPNSPSLSRGPLSTRREKIDLKLK